MAYLTPDNLPPVALLPGHAREIETLQLLKKRLPPDYTVYHGVHWSKGWAAATAFGEADFIIVNQAGSVLVIEQKAGALAEGEGGLGKAYDGRVKSVTSQLHRTLDALRDKFRRQTGHALDPDYLLFCPDHRVRQVEAAGLDIERIVDATDADRLPERIRALLPAAAPSDRGQRVHRFFEQTLDLVPDIHRRLEMGAQHFTRATDGLAGTVGSLSGRPLRLQIRGTAGCGKSLVALKAYRDALAAGRRPLLLCFNRALKEKMARHAGKGVIETWFGAIAAVLKETGRPLDHSKPVDWVQAVDRVLEGDVPDGWRFDTVIVDEGQDFDPAWGDMLELFATADADRIWMDDPDQAIQYGREVLPDAPWPPAGWTGFRARQNYRSPQSVARYIKQLLPEFSFEAASPLPGMGVGTTRIADRDETADAVGRIAASLVKSGLAPENIVVLSLAGLERATLSKAERCGGHTLARFTGDYDPQGNQLWTAGQLRFDTIRRYKGQQDAAVILTDLDPPADPAREPHWRRLLFAALTRATERVELVAGPACAARWFG